MAVNISDATRVVATNDVAFFVGDAAEYANTATISSDGIYFIRDTGSIYRGGREYGAGHIADQDGLNTGYTNVNDTYENLNISDYGTPGITKPNVLTFKVNSDGRLDLKHIPSNVLNSSLWYKDSTNNNIPDAIKTYVTAIHHLKREIVNSLPTIGDQDTIYMLKATNDDPGTTSDSLVNHYDEYMYINDKWELIGDSRTVLKDYAYWKDAVMQTGVNGKVQNVTGGLKLTTTLETGESITIGGSVTTNGKITAGGDIDLPSGLKNTVHNISTPINNSDATNKAYVDVVGNNAQIKAEQTIVNNLTAPEGDDDYGGRITLTASDGTTKTVIISKWGEVRASVNANTVDINELKTITIPDIQSAESIVVGLYNNDDITPLKRKTTKGVIDVKNGGGIDINNGTIQLCPVLPSNITVPADRLRWIDDEGRTIYIPASSIITTGENSLESWVLQKINDAGHLSYVIVPEGQPLSSITKPDTHTIYMIKQTASEDKNYYDEYMYINSEWELIGDSRAILNGYITETQSDKKYIQPSELSFSKGSTNGAFNVSVKGVSTSVSVCGLTSTAYTDKSYFAAATDLNWNELP